MSINFKGANPDYTSSLVLTKGSNKKFIFLRSLSNFDKSNLIAYWDFNQNNANPTFGNPTYLLINSGSITYSAGKLGNGINLPAGSRVRVTQNLWNMITSPTNFSVAFWVKKNSASATPQEAIILGSLFGPMAFYFSFSDQNGGNLDQTLSYAQTTGASQYKHISTNYTMVLGQWIHLVGTYDLIAQTMKFYLNGNLVGTEINVAPPINTPHPDWTGFAMNGSTIGTEGSEYGDDQSFDMVSLWNRTLAASEVQSLYNNNNGLEL